MLLARFVKAETFKNFVDGLEELLTEATLKWTPSGLELLVLDAHDVSAVQFNLSAASFDKYQCDSYKSFGLRMAALIRIMKRVGPNDILSFAASEAGNSFTVRYESQVRKCEYELYLIPPRDLMIPEPEVACVMKMPAEKFASIVGKLANVSKTITVTCTAVDGVEFSGRGEDGKVRREWLKDLVDTSCNVYVKTADPLTLNFASEYLKLIAKNEIFGSEVHVLLRQAFPIAVEYAIRQGIKLTCYLPPLAV